MCWSEVVRREAETNLRQCLINLYRQRDIGSRKRENDNANREFEGNNFENEGDGGFLFN